MAGISDILKKSTDTDYSLTEVMSRALQGRTTFGKALNQIRSEELKARESEAGIDIAKQRMDLAEREFDFNQKKFRAQYANADAKAFEDRFGFWSEGMSKPDQVKLYDYAKNHEQPLNAGNADDLLSEGIGNLGLKKQATPPKASSTPIKVYDETSTTKYSWKIPATGEIVGEAPPTGGLKAKFNPKTGEFEISTGPGGMTTKTKGAMEEKIMGAADSLVSIKDIKGAFKPEYQTLATRWQAMTTAIREKVEGIPPLEWVAEQFGEGDRELLRDFTVYRRRAFENMNNIVRDMSGTAVSVQEANRLIRQLPDPGTGLFDGDSPTAFYGKLLDVERSLKRVVARYNYARRNGIEPMSLDLYEIEGIMEKRWNDIFKALPQDQDEIQRASETDRLVKEEFGL